MVRKYVDRQGQRRVVPWCVVHFTLSLQAGGKDLTRSGAYPYGLGLKVGALMRLLQQLLGGPAAGRRRVPFSVINMPLSKLFHNIQSSLSVSTFFPSRERTLALQAEALPKRPS